METLIISAVLGVVQAITEFLPISSTGHLILAKKLFNFDENIFGLSFDIILHFGTLVALIVYFRKDLIALMDRKNNNQILPGLIIGTIPAILIGLVFNNFIENNLRNVYVIMFTLVFVGILFIIVENISSKKRSMDNMKIKDALFMGLAQSIALIPGVSRSGITITSGLLLGIKREDAAKFSFLLSIPIIFLVSVKDLYDLSRSSFSLDIGIYLVGFFVSAFVSFFVIKFLLDFLRKYSLKPFAYYRFFLAMLILIFLI